MFDAALARLCLGVPNEEADVRGALADRLEELGTPLPPGTRKHLSEAGPLYLVGSALPGRVCDELACDFAERVLPVWESAYPRQRKPRQALEARRAWLAGQLPDEGLLALVKPMAGFYRKTRPLHHDEPIAFENEQAVHAAWAVLRAYGLDFEDIDHNLGPFCSLVVGGEHLADVAESCDVDPDASDEVRGWQREHVCQWLWRQL